MNDAPFRTALSVIWLIFLPVPLYYRLRSRRGGPVSRWGEGPVILFGLRLSALLVIFTLWLWFAFPLTISWAHLPISDALRWAGLPITLLAMLWVWWMFHHLGANLTDTVAVRPRATFVTSGPYRFVRHPFYLGIFAIILGTALLVANGLLLLALALIVAFLLARTPIEEANLIARFGSAYQDYASRTPRYVPPFLSNRHRDRSRPA